MYEKCLAYELRKRGLHVETQVRMPVVYDDVLIDDDGYRIDLLVESRLVVELKAVDELADTHRAQLLTYLKLSEIRLGVLMNFNAALLKNGIERRVN